MAKSYLPEPVVSTAPELLMCEPEEDLTGGLGNAGLQDLLGDKHKPSGAVAGGVMGGVLGTLALGPVGGVLGGLGGAWLGDWLTGERAQDTDLSSFKAASAGDVALDDIPDQITLPPDLVQGMDEAWGDSFPDGSSQEQGGIYVEKPDGSYEWRRGAAGDSGTFSPNWGDRQDGETTRAVVHTHPYDESEGGMRDVAFSGGDFSSLIYQDSPQLDLLQSGETQFGLVQSKEFRQQVAGLDDEGKEKMGQDMETLYDEVFDKHEGSFQEKCDAAARAVAGKYKIAYFKGKGGELSRVDTSG